MSGDSYLKALFWLGVGTWVLVLVVTGQIQGFQAARDFIAPSGIVLSVLSASIFAFEKWIWHWPGINPLFVKTPRLTGAYKGQVVTEPNDPASDEEGQTYDVYVSITQTLSTISVRLFSSRSTSESFSGTISIASDGDQELIYTYINTPNIGQRNRGVSHIHHGGAKLQVTENKKRLAGVYWTDRKSLGTVDVQRKTRKTCKSFDECMQVAI